jgi:CMP-N,N'-diacetyllegionaminic acid synthase
VNVLCVVAARGGSEGVKGKNVRPMAGKALIARAVETALGAPEIGRVVVSTDSPEIAAAARKAGAETPFERPSHLAASGAGKFQVWQHALMECERIYGNAYDLFVDIDCTNPLLDSEDVSAAIGQYQSARAAGRHVDAIFTIAHARRNPYFNLVEPDRTGALRMSKSAGPTILARQAAPPVFEHIAGVYVLDPAYLRTANHLLEGHAEGHLLPPEKALDIDTELDFAIAAFLLERRTVGPR